MAADMSPFDLAIAYIVRAQARYGSYLLQHSENNDGAARIPLRMAALDKGFWFFNRWKCAL